MSFIIAIAFAIISFALTFVCNTCIEYINGDQTFYDRESYYRKKSIYKFWYYVGCISSGFSFINLLYEMLSIILITTNKICYI